MKSACSEISRNSKDLPRPMGLFKVALITRRQGRPALIFCGKGGKGGAASQPPGVPLSFSLSLSPGGLPCGGCGEELSGVHK